jgi:nucleotide-binding universal stress UspA family protein
MQLKKILWASDGSKESDEALKWANILANRFGAKVIALNVLETLNAESLKSADHLKREISLIESGTGQTQARRLTRGETCSRKLESNRRLGSKGEFPMMRSRRLL